MTQAVVISVDIGMLPEGAFDVVEVPVLTGHLIFGGTQHQLWLCRVIWVTAHALTCDGRKPTAAQIVDRISSLDQVDQLYIEYAQRALVQREPDAWARVMQLTDGLTFRALPLRYKNRDMRVAALKLVMQRKPVIDVVFKGLVSLTEHDPERYHTLIMLASQIDAVRLARLALSAIPQPCASPNGGRADQ